MPDEQPSESARPRVSHTQHAALPPFDFGGDLILRTADGVNFHVFKSILSQTSQLFSTMFSLPQQSTATEAKGPSPDSESLPVVDVSEHREEIDALLRVCYPIPSPPLNTIREASLLLEAASKYDVTIALESGKEALLKLVDSEPLRVYAISCRFRFPDLAKAAAFSSLHKPMADMLRLQVRELRSISGEDFQRLARFRVEQQNVVADCVQQYAWVYAQGSNGLGTPYFWQSTHGGNCPMTMNLVSGVQLQPWWEKQMRVVSEKLRHSLDVSASITTEGFLQAALMPPLVNCPSCMGVALSHIKSFINRLKEEIERRQSEVVLDVSYLADE